MSFCLETYLQQSDDYEIHLSNSGFKQCAKLIREKAPKIININPGDKILEVRVIGIPPIPIGIDEDKGTVLIPYTKPCHGSAVVELPVEASDIENINELSID